jgi:hypothetical protein
MNKLGINVEKLKKRYYNKKVNTKKNKWPHF